MIDLHAHILPGLDDGPAEMEEAVTMCRIAADDGTTAIVATPHMFGEIHNVGCSEIREGVTKLQTALAREAISLVVRPGADVHVVPGLDRLLRDGRVMTLGDGGKYLLLELPTDVMPEGLPELLFAIQLLGITPIIAHPERNLAIQANPFLLVDYVESGNLIQLTAGSLLGEFGRDARQCAEALLMSRMAHLIASDAHSAYRRRPGLSKALARARELSSAEEVEEIFVHRPLKVLGGQYFTVPEPIRQLEKRSMFQRMGFRSRVKSAACKSGTVTPDGDCRESPLKNGTKVVA
ncbi:MAG: tyrosine protein phosphatase [Candidatus Abyssubacteria bacterium]